MDAGHNGGAVERYQIFHLPALFVVCEGQFLGQLQTRLTPTDLAEAVPSPANACSLSAWAVSPAIGRAPGARVRRLT